MFRYAPQAKRKAMGGQPERSKERRRVCVLSEQDGRLLEHFHVEHRCYGHCTHHHQTRDEVDKLVRDGVLRYVPGSERNVATYTYGRTWKGVPSGGPLGPKVMQLV